MAEGKGDEEINYMLCQLDKYMEENKDGDGTLSAGLYQKLIAKSKKPCLAPNKTNNKLKRSQSLTFINDENKNSNAKCLLDELKKAKEKLQRPCEMCKDYECKLQAVESHEREVRRQITFKGELIKECKAELKKEKTLRIELEEKFTCDAKENEQNMIHWKEKLDNSNKQLSEIRSIFSNFYNEANHKISTLTNLKEQMCRELERLHSENDALLGRHIVKSEEMQGEIIDMPNDLGDMQFYCLKMREDLITALLAKERIEETFRSEVHFLKEQNLSEQQAKETIEENLTEENDSLRGDRDKFSEELTALRKEHEEQRVSLEKCQDRLSVLIVESDQQISDFVWQVGKLTKEKSILEDEATSVKKKMQSLQVELDNSETVQRDFVKLSQSLQIQLEKIRQTNTEIRWQHEDDAYECNQCKKIFHSRKEKSHCSHCGRVFCIECNIKVIYGGPNRRPFKVCSVCHTLLDPETAPYFSHEPPQSPT